MTNLSHVIQNANGGPTFFRLVFVLALGVYLSSFIKDLVCAPRPFAPPVTRLSRSNSILDFPKTHSCYSDRLTSFGIRIPFHALHQQCLGCPLHLLPSLHPRTFHNDTYHLTHPPSHLCHKHRLRPPLHRNALSHRLCRRDASRYDRLVTSRTLLGSIRDMDR